MTPTEKSPVQKCQASRGDGECFWRECPQLRDGEPRKTGRHCPLDQSTNKLEAYPWYDISVDAEYLRSVVAHYRTHPKGGGE